jgi:uncharacterized damage-inducible protein DinB
MLRGALLFLMCIASPAMSQEAPVLPYSNAEYARQAWLEVRANLDRAAAEASDSVFAYRPTAEVRSFLETLDHIAASEAGYCQMALGERPVGGGDGTGAKTKADVLVALQTARTVCDRAYGQPDSVVALPAFGSRRTTRLHVLLSNAIHDVEHYGNIVTYLRMNGIVPPSSRPTAP